jgi:hypothetical protein
MVVSYYLYCIKNELKNIFFFLFSLVKKEKKMETSAQKKKKNLVSYFKKTFHVIFLRKMKRPPE